MRGGFWFFFFFSSRRRHTRLTCDWSSDVCSSDLAPAVARRQAKPLVGEQLLVGRRIGDFREIGRASCRGKSVDLGGRRIIKKKNSEGWGASRRRRGSGSSRRATISTPGRSNPTSADCHARYPAARLLRRFFFKQKTAYEIDM